MIIADLHNDTAYELYYGRKKLKSNNLHIDLTKQIFSKNLLFYSIYMNPEKYGCDKWDYFYNIYNYFIKETEENKEEIEIFESINKFMKNRKHNAVLTLEGGDLIEKTEDITTLSKLKMKAITLTWNNSNKIASSSADDTDYGLTSFGKEILLKMEEDGIFADLSHASDKTFFDVMKVAKKPVMVTHSNSREVFYHKRNITDEMFFALKENGGLLGINLYGDFLGKNASVTDILRHTEHFLKLGGEDNIALGSDFDGMDKLPLGISDFSSMPKLYEIFKKEFSKEIADKIICKNTLGFLQ